MARPRPGEPALTAFVYDPASNDPAGLAPRESAIWKIDLAENHADPVLLEADARGMAGEQWNAFQITADVEADPTVAVI